MIAIVNMGESDSELHKSCNKEQGAQYRKYEVRINKEVIATFDHDRNDGLRVCLLGAAGAVKERDG
jgi:hypothetical protein